MAIFETFTLLFKADSAQLKKEVDDVNKKTKEILKLLKTLKNNKKTDNEFVNLGKSLSAIATRILVWDQLLGV